MIQTRTNEFLDSDSAITPGQEPSDRLKQHRDDAKRQAGEVGQKATEAAHQASESLKRAGRDAADRVTETARQTGSQVRERASAVVADRKAHLA
ncbi:MAG: hypothetical protein M3552_19325, partial [Planctomycetota bacterium]|nr:hypothetical protein [Planctomycetota bacterium]